MPDSKITRDEWKRMLSDIRSDTERQSFINDCVQRGLVAVTERGLRER